MSKLVAALIAVAVLAGCSAPAPAQSITHNAVKLRWTAPGDDSLSGRAAQYDLRYSTTAITAANFAAATRFAGTPLPSVSGAADSVTVTGLAPSTAYWFAIKTADEVSNWSAISNVVTATTLAAPDVTPPAAVQDLRLGAWMAKMVMVRW